MPVTLESGVLSRAMKTAASIVSARNTIPILSNVRLEVKGDALEVVTSNLDIEFRQRIPIVSGEPLATTVEAKRLSAIAGAVESGAQIALSLGDKRLTVKSGRSRWVLPVLPVDDFPVLPCDASAQPIQMNGPDLAQALNRVLWSVSSEETRYYLCGAFFNMEEGKLRLACTNGHTLAAFTTRQDWPSGWPDVIAPTIALRTIERLCAEAEQISLVWDDAKIRVTAGDVILTAKLIDGVFPDYRRVIPASVENPIIIDPEPTRKALRRVDMVGSKETRCVAMTCSADMIDFSMTNGGEGSQACEQVPATCAAGHRTGFNVSYLASALEAIGGDTVEIHQSEPSTMALIRRTINDGSLAVVMPMRV